MLDLNQCFSIVIIAVEDSAMEDKGHEYYDRKQY